MALAEIVQRDDLLTLARYRHRLRVVLEPLDRRGARHVQPVFVQRQSVRSIEPLDDRLPRSVLQDVDHTVRLAPAAAVRQQNLVRRRAEQHEPRPQESGRELLDGEAVGQLERGAVWPRDDRRSISSRRCMERLGQLLPVDREPSGLRSHRRRGEHAEHGSAKIDRGCIIRAQLSRIRRSMTSKWPDPNGVCSLSSHK